MRRRIHVSFYVLLPITYSRLTGGSGVGGGRAQQKAAEETRAVFGPLKTRIAEAVARLEEQIAAAEGEGAPADELAKAKEVLASAPKEE